MKRLAIINPSAGNGRTGRSLRAILKGIETIADDHVVTQSPAHTRETARGAREFGGLVAVGGDGTVCAVVNAMDLEKQTLAIVPTGTGNSLARDFGINTLESAVMRAHAQTPLNVDLVKFTFCDTGGRRDERYSSSTASVGYAARVAWLANRRLKGLGRFCYPVASIACALRAEYMNARILFDNGPGVRKRLTGLMVQNTRHAGNFEVSPGARSNDGFFDIVETDAGFVGQTLHSVSVLSRTHFFRPAGTGCAATMRIEPETPQLLMIDGELLTGIVDIGITVVPRRLKCCL